ncbi:MAG: phosphoribosylformylglycinamidine synthase subunit PurL [Candidatus Sabulitectum sp.]|nr:phosphoribosylformylglycinamidine synthase subunit PurL [Candidatus Sabulitectum sp.]
MSKIPDREELRNVISSRGLAMTVEEAEKLAGYVDRMPTPLEFHLFDTMWSEHCSYKSSKSVLNTLPTDSPGVVIGPGEDAGVVSFCHQDGIEWDLVVAHESHNHPSQVLPVEGAATGVGGIVRDVYCMGARVTGSMDLLRFGDPEGSKGEATRGIVRGVVEGIWKYGNALGVPNMGGDTEFHPGYDDNCLVNVVAFGVVPHDRIIHSFVPEEAHKEPYVLVLTGKPTDNTGFGGATFASADLDGEQGMGSVQVADPFLKRVLSEANQAVLDMLFEKGVKFGFKDLGAGGIACVTSELAAHGGLGIDVDLDAVPVSIKNLPPEVIACSETQERYGLAVPVSVVDDILSVYNEKFELPRLFPNCRAAVIGRFNSKPVYNVICRGENVAETPINYITEGVVYQREECPMDNAAPEPAQRPCDPSKDLTRILTSISGCSRKHIWSYYDSEVQGVTRLRPGEADSCVSVPVEGSRAGLAVSGDGNPWYGELDPFLGGAHAVGEAVRNVVATGATPICATDCLNFGNPEDPKAFWQFKQAVAGIAEACNALGFSGGDYPLPIVSGNVSFYNQSTGGKAIPPSPIVAVFGKIHDHRKATDIVLRKEGNLVLLIGTRKDELGGSLFYRTCLGHHGGTVPTFRGSLEKRMADWILGVIHDRRAYSVHDISGGGLAVAGAEMALASRKLGIEFSLDSNPVTLFSETPGYLVEVDSRFVEDVTLPEFVSVAGKVCMGCSVSGNGWSVDLESLRKEWSDKLASVIWREEGV